MSVSSYYLARRSLYITLDHELDERIDDVRDFFAAHQLSRDYDDARTQAADEFQIKDYGKWLQIEDDKGRWIYRSKRIMMTPHELPAATALPLHGSISESGANSKRFRSLCRSFILDGHTYVVEEGITLTKTDQALALFRNSLWLISPVVLLMAGLAGHLLSRRALDPVAAIAREAQRIHDGNLQSRLPRLTTRDELAHLSSTLNEMLERIESGVRSVRDFTAYASHELRTPVAMIRSEADLALQFERTGPEYREAIATIGAEALRMSSLLNSLLFLARADSGAERVQLESVDARRLCSIVCEKWRGMLAKTQVRVVADLAPGPLMVMADPTYLQRLLNIILENAGKYTPRGGCVTLTLIRERQVARFQVSDTGIGIPAHEQGRIFERFYRGSNVQESGADGSGLGLALAGWIAARHGTEIEVTSARGDGSRFAWSLPLATQNVWTAGHRSRSETGEHVLMASSGS